MIEVSTYREPEPLSDQAWQDDDLKRLAKASRRLACNGVRLIPIDGVMHAGIWSDTDSPEIRAALRTCGSGDAPVIYLDSPRAPLRYKVRRFDGEPVPTHVREAMEQSGEPWTVRDQMLGWAWRFVPWPLAEPAEVSHEIDPETGIEAIAAWGSACGNGFVSNSRFGPNQRMMREANQKPTIRRPLEECSQ